MSWAVVGSTGFIGRHLVTELRRRGEVVREISAPRLRMTGPVSARIVVDAADGADEQVALLADRLRGCSAVINAAGLATPGGQLSPELVGANSMLPRVIALAAQRAGCRRLVHLSSAAVQGRAPVLDESDRFAPFSPYSLTKSWGERALTSVDCADGFDVVSVRATSVQGGDRPTTQALRRLARSPFASVAGDGSNPSPVSSIDALVHLVLELGEFSCPLPRTVLQPWEGQTTQSVLLAAGSRSPRHLSPALCRAALGAGSVVSRLTGRRLDGIVRRVEMMWFGQKQEPGWIEHTGMQTPRRIEEVLRASRTPRRPTIGILSQWYDPEPGPAAIPGVLAREFVAAGCDVKVLTGFPNYPSGRLHAGYRQKLRDVSRADGITVTRVPLITSHDGSALGRVANYCSFAISATVFGRGALRGCDGIWVYNSPVTVSLPLMVHTRGGRVPYLLHVQDLWPESLLESGMMPGGPIGRLAGSIVTRVVSATEHRARVVAVISPGVAPLIRGRNPRLDASAIVYLPNPADEQLFRPRTRRGPIGHEFTLMYAGAVGAVQGLETLLEAVARVSVSHPVRLLIVGDGIARESLQARAERLRATTITFLGAVTKSEVAELMREADAQVVALRDSPFLRLTAPSKVANLLASRVPILGIVAGDSADLLTRAGCGRVAAPGDVDGVARAILDLAMMSRAELDSAAAAGRSYYEDHLSARPNARRIVSLLSNELLTHDRLIDTERRVS